MLVLLLTSASFRFFKVAKRVVREKLAKKTRMFNNFSVHNACMHAYIHAYNHARMHSRIHARKHACIHTRKHAHTHKHTHMDKYSDTHCTHACMYIHMYKHACTHARTHTTIYIHTLYNTHTCNFIPSCSYPRCTSSSNYWAETKTLTVRPDAQRICRTQTAATDRARRATIATRCRPLATRWRNATGLSIRCATRSRCSHHVIAASAPVLASLSRAVAREMAPTRVDHSVDSSVELVVVQTQSEGIPRKCPFRIDRTVAVVPIVILFISQTTNVLM